MHPSTQVAAVTVNPSIDQTLEIADFTRGAVNRVTSSQLTAGGKGNNAAAYLADYGFPVIATGFLGDINDAIFRQFFAAKRIADRFIRIPGDTRVCVKITDPLVQQTTDINFPGLTPTPAEIDQLLACLSELKTSCSWFMLAGSLPPGLPPEIYREMVSLLDGCKVVVDTSGDALHQALEAQPTMIKPNLNELEELCGEALYAPGAVCQAARELAARFGIQLVAVSMGKDGAVLVDGDQAVWAIPPAVAVRTTVGAGDAMVAGIIAGKIQGLSLEGCARLGTAFAVHALGKVGAGLASLAELEAAVSQVRLIHPVTGSEIYG